MVCLVCDAPKERGGVSRCAACDRDTASRSVGGDAQPIAPSSTLTFREQREIYLRLRGRKRRRSGSSSS